MTSERLRQLEAVGFLCVTRVAVAVLPFRLLRKIFVRDLRAAELDGSAREQARRDVRRAVHRAKDWLPGTVCLPKAIAAQAMLRRRGVPTTLYFGAAKQSGAALQTHAWLQDGEFGVTGSSRREHFQPVAAYSAGTRTVSTG